MNLQQLLKVIESGQTGFQPQGDSENELEAFQPVVRLILDAYELGYIETVKPHKESYTGRRLYNGVIARGVTDSGREYIDDH